MKIEEIDLSNVESLKNFYTLFDEKALLLQIDHNVTDMILKYKNKTSSDDERQRLQWEVEASLFSFQGSRIFSFSTSNGKEVGQISEYPQLDLYQSTAFEFLKERVEISSSAFLKARYNHLIWKGIGIKRKSFAESAIENYILSIKELEAMNIPNSSYEIGKLFENLLSVGNDVKDKFDEIKKLTFFLLFGSSNISFYAKHGIVDDMLKYSKIFKPIDFENVLSIFENHLISAEEEDDFFLANYHLPTAVKVAQKLKGDVKRWQEEIGDRYFKMAARENDLDRSMIKIELYRIAIDAYMQSGNQEKKEEAEQLYFQVKPNVVLNEFSIDFDEETIKRLHELDAELKLKASDLLKLPPDDIYRILATGKLYPKYQEVLIASDHKKGNFWDFATTLYFDKNKNVSRTKDGDDKKKLSY